jgi:hypothetical protein
VQEKKGKNNLWLDFFIALVSQCVKNDGKCSKVWNNLLIRKKYSNFAVQNVQENEKNACCGAVCAVTHACMGG